MAQHIAFILKGYPRLSETFIAQEIQSLIGLGFDLTIYALRHPSDDMRHPVHDEINATVCYLPEYLHHEPLRVLKAALHTTVTKNFKQAAQAWWRDFKRDPSYHRIRRFGQALVLARELKDNTNVIHAHFIHAPASVARYTALLCALPWSCSAHAKDIWTTPQWDLREKLSDCRWLTTCTAYNMSYLCTLTNRDTIKLNYHGIDLKRFPSVLRHDCSRDGSEQQNPVRLLSVGRAVVKKGYHCLLQILADLPQNIHWTFTHIGGGELLTELKQYANDKGIGSRCYWLGPKSQPVVLEQYRCADLFILCCTIDKNGDQDGLPNVIIEAQSQSLAVLSSNISGIPELITHAENGLLADADDTVMLRKLLIQLIAQPNLRMRFGQIGRAKVCQLFDKDRTIQSLAELFD